MDGCLHHHTCVQTLYFCAHIRSPVDFLFYRKYTITLSGMQCWLTVICGLDLSVIISRSSPKFISNTSNRSYLDDPSCLFIFLENTASTSNVMVLVMALISTLCLQWNSNGRNYDK